MPLRYSNRSQARVSFSISVPVKIIIRVPRTGLVPASTSNLQPKPGAPAFSLTRRNLFSLFPFLSQLPSLPSIAMTAPVTSAQPA